MGKPGKRNRYPLVEDLVKQLRDLKRHLDKKMKNNDKSDDAWNEDSDDEEDVGKNKIDH